MKVKVVNQGMLNVDLEEKERLVKALFYNGLINAGMYVDLREIIAKERTEEQPYQPTIEEINKYWS